MPRVENRILLIGDPAWDRMVLPLQTSGGQQESDRLFHRQWESWDIAGGAYMTQRMLEEQGGSVDAIIADDVDRFPQMVASLATLCRVDKDDAAGRDKWRLRVEQLEGYSKRSSLGEIPPRSKFDRDRRYRTILINDAGAEMRKAGELWKGALDQIADGARRPERPLIIYKMHLPLVQGDLWSRVTEMTGCDRIVLVLAEDLRRDGISLSRCLSWEGVLEDLYRNLNDPDGKLSKLLKGCEQVIILFDVEATIIVSDQGERVEIVVDPSVAEGDLDEQIPGTVVGKMNAFVTSLTIELARRTGNWSATRTVEASKTALKKLQAFTKDEMKLSNGELTYPSMSASGVGNYQNFTVPDETDSEGKICVKLSMLDTEDKIFRIARDVVIHGLGALNGLPSAHFGDLTTVDRKEIEGYRAIKRLLSRYLAEKSLSKPISIAVFGPPGSGKSFGVKQLLNKDEVPVRTFNLSEAKPSDLSGFFHEIRDFNLEGKTPLCFFDEFDTGNLKFLSSFLAPMQDGEFRDSDGVHPIGRGIFVFAGGTSEKFQDFEGSGDETESGNNGSAPAAKLKRDKALKKPDFVSRLSGYIDIRGPNVDLLRDQTRDDEHILRRAILLRSFLERFFEQIIQGPDKKAAIDDDLLGALLRIKTYNHGARSMELLLRMCSFGPDSDRLTVSDLPERYQMEIHVCHEAFMRLVHEG